MNALLFDPARIHTSILSSLSNFSKASAKFPRTSELRLFNLSGRLTVTIPIASFTSTKTSDIIFYSSSFLEGFYYYSSMLPHDGQVISSPGSGFTNITPHSLHSKSPSISVKFDES